MAGIGGSKGKGRVRHHPRVGLGRLRRAHAKDEGRRNTIDTAAHDDDLADTLTETRPGRTAPSLLAKFNRLSRQVDQAEGEPGEVSGFEGTWVLVRRADGSECRCVVRRVLAKMLGGVKNPLVIGDQVRFLPGHEAQETVITALAPRRNQLLRTDSHNRSLVQVIAANVDHLVIVSAVAQPELKTGLIDRYLVIAHACGIEPVLVINKSDLGEVGTVRDLYRNLGYRVFLTKADPPPDGDLAALRQVLRGTSCVVVGHSGVGKSSLINALYPDSAARVGEVSSLINKGRHTTNASRSYLLPEGGRLIDTPGIRACSLTGLTGLSAVDVSLLYRDLARHAPACRFPDCQHREEPGCAVREAVETGSLDPRRYLSYLSILAEDLGLE